MESIVVKCKNEFSGDRDKADKIYQGTDPLRPEDISGDGLLGGQPACPCEHKPAGGHAYLPELCRFIY